MQSAPADAGGAFRIDVHYHVASPGWSRVMREKGLLGGPWSKWNVERAIDDMDRDAVATSVASVTTPGVWFESDEQARSLARECNEYMAEIATGYPGRLGLFAAVPMPDVDGSLREIEYALDVLKADGIGMFTSYRDRWLGDNAHTPILAELNRRSAILYVHPTAPCSCAGCLPYMRDSAIEYGTDTTRAIASMVFGGASTRYPNLRVIFSHGGGTMPYLIERFFQQKRAQELSPGNFPTQISTEELARLDPLGEVQRFYYDVAQSTHVAPLSALVHVVPTSRILFGTDYPYRTAADHALGLRDSGLFNVEALRAIEYDNARGLLPCFAP
jgi:predicted TIM-barrel fold metal-dependent hydrolase